MQPSKQSKHEPSPTGARFRNPEQSARALDRLRLALSPGIFQSLLTFLPAAPDTDTALSCFERLAASADAALLHRFQQSPSLIHYALLLFGYSDWLAETLIANPDLFADFAADRRRFHQPRSHDDFAERLLRLRAQPHQLDDSTLLARFKRREYAGILLRDVLGIFTLSQVTTEISCLSDVIIQAALQKSQSAINSPVPLAILALGKLGGNELNYSSDVDLLFLYGGPSTPSNREQSVRLAQDVVQLLSRHTAEGPAFRVDLRLRPQGGQEEIAVELNHAIRYYSETAQSWELQALIKARHVAGDQSLTRRFLQSVERQVYRPGLNFAAIKTALQSREKIDRHRRTHARASSLHHGTDVKLDHGGIRDIEFLVQCLQRVFGGAEPWLRSSGTLFALQKLYDKQHLSSSDFQRLSETYVFLRNIEHRLQVKHGRQTHLLQHAPPALELMARSISPEGAAVPTADAFLLDVRTRMSQVSDIYRRIVFEQQAAETSHHLPPPEPTPAHSRVSIPRRRTPALAPELQSLVDASALTQHGHRKLSAFLAAANNADARTQDVLRQPQTLTRALQVLQVSDLLADVLSHHPEDAALLASLDEHPALATEAFPSPLPHASGALLPALRTNFGRGIFTSAARDILFPRDIYASLHERTQIAEATIRAAWSALAATEGVAVLALGRLGSSEFDVLSDADLIFVADESADRASAHDAAQQLVGALTLYTRDGAVFAVDSRLRPHGKAGELVNTPSQMRSYFAENAAPWESLTYLRLRYVAGDPDVAEAAIQAVREILLPSTLDKAQLGSDLRETRQKLESSAPRLNFKTGPGGLYDIDYVLGALQIQNSLHFPANLDERIALLRNRSLISTGDADTLQHNARFLRSLERAIRLATGKPSKWLPSAEHAMRSVEQLMAAEFKRENSLRATLNQVLQQNREIYRIHSQSW